VISAEYFANIFLLNLLAFFFEETFALFFKLFSVQYFSLNFYGHKHFAAAAVDAFSALIFLPCVARLLVPFVDELFVRHLNLQVHLGLVFIVHQVIGFITERKV
jgi:hypothetical protein